MSSTIAIILEVIDLAMKGQAALELLRATLATAAAEGRDLTDAEVDAIRARAGVAHDRLDQAIADRTV